mgnify:CR=1 FL=1
MPRLEAMVRAHAQEILCLKANPLRATFITGGNDKRVRVWSLQSYELLATLEGHEERVWHCAWSRDGRQLASCGSDRSVRLWSCAGEAELASPDYPATCVDRVADALVAFHAELAVIAARRHGQTVELGDG